MMSSSYSPFSRQNVICEDVSFGVVNHGAAELRVFVTAFIVTVPDFRLELVNGSLKGGHGTIEWILSGTDVGLFRTGRRFSVRRAAVIEVHGKLIFRNSDYYHLATVSGSLGCYRQGYDLSRWGLLSDSARSRQSTQTPVRARAATRRRHRK
jgi:hypothetical protein